MAWLSSVLIALLGMVVPGAVEVAPASDARRGAAVAPPREEGGLLRAAATRPGVAEPCRAGPARILDTGGDPAALERLRAGGLALLDAGGVFARAGGAA